MKIPSKWELQQIAINHSADVGFKDSMNFYRKCTAKPYVLFNDTTLASDNHLYFRHDLLEGT